MTMKEIRSIEELGPEIARDIESGAYADHWTKVGLSAGPRCTTQDVIELLKIVDLPCHTVIWAPEGPVVAGRALRLVLGGVDLRAWHEKDIDSNWVESNMSKAAAVDVVRDGYLRYGQHDASWIAYLLAFKNVVDMPEVLAYEKIVRGASWWFYHDSVAIMCPSVTPNLDPEGELHNTEGPAIWQIYALHGVLLPPEFEWIVKDRESLTQQKIDAIDNAEIRRVTIASYPERYVTGKPIQVDEYGELYEVPGDHGYRLVKVKDASSERRYWLRVPPTCKTAHEGVASTFSMSTKEYRPEIQT